MTVPSLSDQTPDRLLEIIAAWAEWHGVSFSQKAGEDLAQALHGAPEAKSRQAIAELTSQLNAATIRAANAEQRLSLIAWLDATQPDRSGADR